MESVAWPDRVWQYEVKQITPADNWYVLMKYTGKNGYEEIPVVSFALCKQYRIPRHSSLEEAKEEGREELCGEAILPVVQMWAWDGTGSFCRPWSGEECSDLGTLVTMYKGKGNHTFKTL